MTTHKTETVSTENFEADVMLLEDDRERFRVAYDIWKMNYANLPIFGRTYISKDRIDGNYYGRLHETWGLEEALDKFESCKKYVMSRMEKREQHLDKLS